MEAVAGGIMTLVEGGDSPNVLPFKVAKSL